MSELPEPRHKVHLARQRAEYQRRRARRIRKVQLQTSKPRPLALFFSVAGAMLLTVSATGGLWQKGLPALPFDLALEAELRNAVAAQGIEPLPVLPPVPADKAKLGKALFFDKILSGNKDISCAGCHAPQHATADALPLSIGTGGLKLGPERTLASARQHVKRHAPDLFNRAAPGWEYLMWDGRIAALPHGQVSIPDVPEPIAGLDGAPAGQVLHTLLNPDEMRGHPGDRTFTGERNELADLAQPQEIWDGLMRRLLAIPGYERQLQRAYPGTGVREFTITHVANAIVAYQRAELDLRDSAWDRWLRGDEHALTARQKRGALLFFGKAQCSQCHAGVLFTDQQPHSLAVPQLRAPGAALDQGAGNYAFRTPPLRNVAHTAPYMHSGVYATLEEAVRHHLDPAGMLAAFQPQRLREDFRPLADLTAAEKQALVAALDPLLQSPPVLSTLEVGQLLAFLHSLSDPTVGQLAEAVPILPSPSDLPVGY